MVMVVPKRAQLSPRVPAQGLGAAILRRMEAQEVGYDQLAIMTGIGRSKLQRIATGDRLQWLHPEELTAIAEALDVTPADLLSSAGYDLESA